MVPRVVEDGRSAVCHGSWGWGAILEVVAPVQEEAAVVVLEPEGVGWPQRLGDEPPWW